MRRLPGDYWMQVRAGDTGLLREYYTSYFKNYDATTQFVSLGICLGMCLNKKGGGEGNGRKRKYIFARILDGSKHCFSSSFFNC